MRDATKIGFCGPTGRERGRRRAQALQDGDRPSDIVSFHGGYHGGSHARMAVSGLVSPEGTGVANRCPAFIFFPYPYALRCPLGAEATVGTALRSSTSSARCATRSAASRCRRR